MNVLLVKNRALGDSIMGLSSVDYLKSLNESLPHATAIKTAIKVTYGLPSWICPLYSQVTTAADEILPIDLKKMSDWPRLYFTLKKKKFDLILELHQTGRTGKFFQLYSKMTNVPYYYHNHHQKTGDFIHDQGVIKAAIQRDLDACWSVFRPPEKPHYSHFPPKMTVDSPTQKNTVIILGVVATRQTKMWPLTYFKDLTLKILNILPERQFFIPLSSSTQDQALAKEIEALNFPNQVKIIKEPLDQLPVVIAGSSLYIGNDTGLKHLCVALDIPTFTFFGPESPDEWHPYSDLKKHRYFFREGLECRTRLSHYCGLQQCESMICLNEITPQRVIQELQAMNSLLDASRL